MKLKLRRGPNGVKRWCVKWKQFDGVNGGPTIRCMTSSIFRTPKGAKECLDELELSMAKKFNINLFKSL